MVTCIGSTQEVGSTAQQALNSGLDVERTKETVRITHEGTHVYTALLKSRNVWLVRYNEEYFPTEQEDEVK